jgi:hypothetical protein
MGACRLLHWRCCARPAPQLGDCAFPNRALERSAANAAKRPESTKVRTNVDQRAVHSILVLRMFKTATFDHPLAAAYGQEQRGEQWIQPEICLAAVHSPVCVNAGESRKPAASDIRECVVRVRFIDHATRGACGKARFKWADSAGLPVPTISLTTLFGSHFQWVTLPVRQAGLRQLFIQTVHANCWQILDKIVAGEASQGCSIRDEMRIVGHVPPHQPVASSTVTTANRSSLNIHSKNSVASVVNVRH